MEPDYRLMSRDGLAAIRRRADRRESVAMVHLSANETRERAWQLKPVVCSEPGRSGGPLTALLQLPAALRPCQ